MQAPRYRAKPFGTIRALARRLGVSERQLRDIAARADNYYYPNKPELKSDGSVRQHYRVHPDLQRIQKAINKSIFNNTDFPPYLTGGIRDPQRPRDYVTDAQAHVGHRYLIEEDIKDFFPSVRAELVRRMWQLLYHLPPDVADLLTNLTTYQGMLPQGAPTSTYIGNLILWDEEPHVVAVLESMGFGYTRYVDNLAISSNLVYPRAQIEEVTTIVYGMLYRHGLRPKRRKRKAVTRRRAQILHGLTLNSGRPAFPRRTRARIRSEIHNYELKKNDLPPEIRHKQYCSLLGKIHMVRRFHPRLAERLLQRLSP